jgi:hypothetical protein
LLVHTVGFSNVLQIFDVFSDFNSRFCFPISFQDFSDFQVSIVDLLPNQKKTCPPQNPSSR